MSEPPSPSFSAESDDAKRSLSDLRARIDALDHRLIELLNERASLVVRVGELKRGSGVPIYSPHREQEVLAKALRLNKGPLSDRTIEAVYREIMSGSFALELPLRIGYLGPAGSFSHQAAVKHFGNSVSFEDVHEVRGVFTEVVRGHCNYGLAPIENSLGGGIVETLDAFMDHGTDISVYAEVLLSVRHALLANCEPSAVKRIYSKAEVFSQCRDWLATQYPRAEQVAATSTSRAVQMVREESDRDPSCGSAAIGSELAGQLYGVNMLFGDIEDDPSNVTRFFVISRQQARPSGDDKTSIMFTTPDKPGALVNVLHSFEANGVNLSHIDKRPSRRENWTYTFFIDAQGHREDGAMRAAVADAQRHCKDLVVLGSYPRARRVL